MIASLMMVTYNRLELTKQTLADLLVTTNYPFELILVDNASQDGTQDFLAQFVAENAKKYEFWKNTAVKLNQENKGIAIARNQCLQLAQGEWLSTLDNDVLLPQGWLSECIDICTKNPKYGMIGVNFENVSYPIVKLNGKEFQRKPKGNLGTACTVFSRKFHQMLGFFNTEYGLYGEEDADLGMRARVVGFELGYHKENGRHLGEGANDAGDYREFKTASHRRNLDKFNENCRLYMMGKKPLYIPFNQ